MKSKILLLVLCVALSLAMLASCDGFFGNGNANEETDPKSFNKIVYTDPELDWLSVRSTLAEVAGSKISMYSPADNPAADGEIVFGDSDRAITLAAKEKLQEIISKSDNDCGYVIYTDGKSIAVYWDTDGMGDIAVSGFVNVCLKEKRLVLTKNSVVTSDLYVRREFEIDKHWLALEAVADSETVAAIRRLYSFYDGAKLAQWCANLYDPVVGGFYYSASGRDTKGYLPDIESTSQLLGMMVNTGALPSRNALPEEIKRQIVDFAKNLQSKDDGYFYHPQWPIGKENLLTERYGRDLGNATSVITNIDFDTDGDGIYETHEYPKWCAPNGVKCAIHEGTDGKCTFPQSVAYYSDAIDSGVTTTLTSSVSSAVSKLSSSSSTVKAVVSQTPDYSSRENFRKWLVEYNSTIKEDSGHAHQLAALQSEITQHGYADVVLDYLDEIQEEVFNEQIANDEEPTGLWQTSVDYNLVYGLLKYGVFHNSSSGGRAIKEKYIPYIVKSCIKVTELPALGDYRMHDIYNQWTSVSTLVKNVKRFYGSSSSQVETIYEIMRESAAELVDNSISKITPFKIGDGSFAHYLSNLSNTEIYGTPIAMGVREGDVNATALCFGMYQAIFQCLGYKMVPICTAADGDAFIQTLLDSEPIEKKNADTKTLDFESGIITSNVTNKLSNSTSVIEIVDDPTGADGKVLSFVSEVETKTGDYLYFDVYSSGTTPTCNIFETRIYVSEDTDDVRFLEIMLGKGFMFTLTKSGETVTVASRSNTLGNKNIGEFTVGEWHTLRFEMYRYDVAENGLEKPETKVWIDREFMGVTDNCYRWSGGTTSNAYGSVDVYSLASANSYVYFDDVFCSTDKKEYNPSDEKISDFRDALLQ